MTNGEQDAKKEDGPLPPRSKLHPSNKLKMTRLFYHVLVVCFLLLTAGLVVWGVQFLE